MQNLGKSWSQEVYALTGNLAQAFLGWESGLELHIFLHLFFLLDLYFPPLLEKESSSVLPQTLSVLAATLRSTQLTGLLVQRQEAIPNRDSRGAGARANTRNASVRIPKGWKTRAEDDNLHDELAHSQPMRPVRTHWPAGKLGGYGS